MTMITGRRRWRLTFGRRIVEDAIFNRSGEIAETWVETDDPEKLKSLVQRGAYSSDEPLRVTLLPDKAAGMRSATVICTAEAIVGWDQSRADLPDGEPVTAANRPVRVTRLSIIRDVHVALAAGVAADMLGEDEASGVVMLVRSLLSRRR